jgi:hypothetical protein
MEAFWASVVGRRFARGGIRQPGEFGLGGILVAANLGEEALGSVWFARLLRVSGEGTELCSMHAHLATGMGAVFYTCLLGHERWWFQQG